MCSSDLKSTEGACATSHFENVLGGDRVYSIGKLEVDLIVVAVVGVLLYGLHEQDIDVKIRDFRETLGAIDA